MAEFCLKCFNEMNGTNDSEEMYVMSKELDLCEGCGKWKPVVVIRKSNWYMFRKNDQKKKKSL